ncbi:MAG: ABC transporter substrate-binding protein [Proteobacteria bacterium]|nr:ABC transporter substrate-binding protein [Pseudomonadota bacterium]
MKIKFIASLLALMLCIAASFCFSVPAAVAEDVRVAVVVSSSVNPYKEALEAYYDELRKRGLAFRSMEFFMDKSLDSGNIVSRIRAYKPALIHSVGTDATRLIKESIKDVPVVFSMVLNPVAGGIIESMQASGNNLTGASMDLPVSLQFSYIRKLKPATKKIGVIYSEKETGAVVREAKKYARRIGLELVAEAVDGPQGVPRAINRLKRKVDFIWSVADGNVFTRETVRELLLVSLRRKLPLMGLSPAFVKAGALFSLSIYPDKVGRQAAGLTMDVLAGEKPSTIPITVPTDSELLVNKNTLKMLGLELSSSILKEAKIVGP